MRKTLPFAAFMALGIAASASSPSQAAAACDLTKQAGELVAIQTSATMDEVEQLRLEVIARHNLTEAAIECDRADIGLRVQALSHVPDKIKTVDAYRKILESLAEAYQYYDNKKKDIQGLGAWDLKAAARETAAWRKKEYLPTITWADNFLIWADNQQFIERASERLTQINGVSFSLKLVNQNEVDDLFEKAETSFKTASSENDEARNALNQKRPLGALVHTQASLKALADTYDAFFALQQALQNIAN
jgi:hypothetical protein